MKQFEETKALLNNSTIFYMISIGMDGIYSYVNTHYSREFSYVADVLTGQPYHITMHPEDIAGNMETARKCFEKPAKLFPATIRKHDGKGGYIYTQWDYKAMLDETGQPAGIFCIGHNITKYVAETYQLQVAKEQIVKYSETMNAIIFEQSHLIRAPLSNILGLSMALKDIEESNTEVKNISAMIAESANKLDDIIKRIVTIAST